jgi:nucleoid DNA-binding protein
VRVVEAHRARNPKTGEEVMVPERNRVRFKAGKVMDEKINNGASQPGGVRSVS